jgi:hypothetical protein
MALQAMWVHGHSATIELNRLGRGPVEDFDGLQWSSLLGLRVGWGVQYRCQDNSNYWFHFAIPTPVIVDGVRTRLRRVMVLFTAGPAVSLRSVHVWDGPNRVFTRDELAIGGANLSLVNDLNSFALPDLEVLWGIGISVNFNFADFDNVTLHTAGIDFES